MRTLATQPIHLIDSNQGIYIPQSLAGMILRNELQISNGSILMDDVEYLFRGPDGESYWETWEIVERGTVTHIPNGQKFTLHHDSDLWLVPEGFEFEGSHLDY